MLFLLFGNKVVKKDAGPVARTCPYCGSQGPHTRVEGENWFTIYWIPLFRVGRAPGFIRCSRCGQTFPESGPSRPAPVVRDPDWTWACPACQNVNPNTAQSCLRCHQTLR